MKASDDSVLTPDDVEMITERNSFITTIKVLSNDRSILNFGEIYNTDEPGTSDFAASTIVVTFTTILIPNEEFDNTTATVTAGAEYASEQYVWVSQAEFNYSHDKIFQILFIYNIDIRSKYLQAIFGANVTACGPDSIPENGAAQFDIDAYITHAFETIEMEIFTPDNIHVETVIK
ncbi:hypothetical protein Avbf_05120 [Armadillidium vulgare]|nr:hypothetical protein Avbf_05120 [Armadillidium vulgare]